MNRIRTYEELITERRRLEGDLLMHQAYIKGQLHDINRKVQPIIRVIGLLGNFKKTSKGSALLKLGSTVGIDLLIGQKLKKAGWLARLLVPLAMKLTAQKTIDKVQDRVSK